MDGGDLSASSVVECGPCAILDCGPPGGIGAWRWPPNWPQSSAIHSHPACSMCKTEHSLLWATASMFLDIRTGVAASLLYSCYYARGAPS